MTLDKPLNEKSDKSDARSGGETPPERFLDRYVGNAIHLFLSFLAILIMIAALIASIEIIIRDSRNFGDRQVNMTPSIR